MLSEALQLRAALYVSGDMTVAERDAFAVVLEYHAVLRAHVAALQEASAVAAVAGSGRGMAPPAALKARVLQALGGVEPEAPEALVVTDVRGHVEWVNPAFVAMCGHTLEELRGRKPGTLLQGPGTDRAAVERIRLAVRERRPCRETLVNYHKDGSAYQADVRILPVLDDSGTPLWFVARERRLADA